ncbi:hypothetical protein FOL88_01860 [Lactobacillus reuteri]|uniref:phage/plasmid primase, P4 family n=1 Tax=Limosilactobacillus reuteri TaxID=1598 RepID=UPI00146C3315|nr:phage/plasmid primase, P4 family [Limosilactobacillus reuteri]NMV53741.1 hypothetical protein [Limosilactobacillus reuteri]NMV57860.1 hypothetical protein [Limosilactobacillus reuteri]
MNDFLDSLTQQVDDHQKENQAEREKELTDKYGLDGTTQELQDYICSVYNVDDIKELLLDDALRFKPLSIYEVVDTFDKEEYTDQDEETKFFLTESGDQWLNLAKYFIPRWVKLSLAKTTGNIKVYYNWYLYTVDYFKNHPTNTFSEYQAGIAYHHKNGAWKVMKKDELTSKFDKALVNNLIPWGVVDDKVMNAGITRAKKLITSQVFNDNASRPEKLSKDKLVAFNNGTYNFATGQKQEHSKDDYLLNIHDYNVNFSSHEAPETDKLLTDMMGPAAKFFKEYIGYCFYPNHDIFQDFIFLLGEGGEGKSTLLNYIKRDLFGSDNTAALDPQTMNSDTDRFATSDLYGKEVNIVPDISSKPLPDVDKLKGLLGADSIAIQFKFGDRFEMTSRAKNIWSANKLPPIRSDDVGQAMSDRANVIKLTNGDTRKSNNNFWQKHDMNKVRSERSQFVGECLYLFQQVLKRFDKGKGQDSWSKPASVKEDAQEWLTNSDPVKQWLTSVKEENASLFEDGYFVKQDAYNDYKIWCKAEGRYPMKKSNLQDALLTRFGFEYRRIRTPNGGQPYCWVNQALADKWDKEKIDWTTKRDGVLPDLA